MIDGVRRVLRSPKLVELAPYAAVGLVLMVTQWSERGWLYPASDDPYIYLGYVKYALGDPPALFSYNPGEHSAGTTGSVDFGAPEAARAWLD